MVSKYMKKRPLLGETARSLAVSPTEGFELKGGDASQKLLLASFSESAKDLEKDVVTVGEALSSFQSAKDKKMEAISQLVLANIYYKQKKGEETLSAASSAMTIFKVLGDKLGQAKAMHAKALAASLTGDCAGAVSLVKEAFAIYSELGMAQGKASELQTMAEFYLVMGKPSTALKAAKEALAIAQAGESKEAEVVPLCLVCEALFASGKTKMAVSLAKEAVDSFSEAKEAIAIGMGLEILMCAKLKESPGDAIQVAEDGLNTIRDLNETRAELAVLFGVADIRFANSQTDDAVMAMKDALSLARELDDKSSEALCHLTIAAIYSETDAAKDDEDMMNEATAAAEEASGLFLEVDDTTGAASAKLILAKLKGDVAMGLTLAKEAAALCEEAGDAAGQLLALGFITDTFGSESAALDAAMSCVEVSRGLGKKELAEALYTLASIFMYRGSISDADDTASEAKAICAEAGLPGLEAKLTILPVQVYVAEMANESTPEKPSDSYIDTRDKAFEAVKMAMILSAKAGDLATRATVLYWKAEVLTWAYRTPEAVQAAKEAEKLYDKVGDSKGLVMSYILIGEMLVILQKKSEAKDYGEKALELAKSSPALEVFVSPAETLLGKLVEKKVVMQAVEMGPAVGAAPAAAAASAAATAVAKPTMDWPVVKGKVTELVKGVLTDDEEVDVDTPFMEAGIDSLGSVQLVTDVGREFRMNLAPSVVFDFPTIRELGEHLVAEMSG
mmetsp:Transcript_142534/g.262878  ORF Transcript_142534/g.262878 Transcript_142534/m.262878 type:complete len:734 (-) Transcript_142534:115-2316(-)